MCYICESPNISCSAKVCRLDFDILNVLCLAFRIIKLLKSD